MFLGPAEQMEQRAESGTCSSYAESNMQKMARISKLFTRNADFQNIICNFAAEIQNVSLKSCCARLPSRQCTVHCQLSIVHCPLLWIDKVSRLNWLIQAADFINSTGYLTFLLPHSCCPSHQPGYRHRRHFPGCPHRWLALPELGLQQTLR